MDRNHSIDAAARIQEDRDFGNYVAGFVDGEGSFILKIQRRNQAVINGRVLVGNDVPPIFNASLQISMRSDDIEILRLIKKRLKCGTIKSYATKQGRYVARYGIYNADDLIRTVIPFFDKHKLRAKKARDYEIWKEGVRLIYKIKMRMRAKHGQRRYPSEMEEFIRLHSLLRQTRKFSANPKLPSEIVKPKTKRKYQPGFGLITNKLREALR